MMKNFTPKPGILTVAKSMLFASVFTLAATNFVQAQTVINENFTVGGPYPQLVLPQGWTQGKWGPSVSSINNWDIVQTSPNQPAAVPPSASTMVRFGSYAIPNGEASFLMSPRLDMRNMPGAGATLTFQFWRDASWSGDPDYIEVYASSVPTVDPSMPATQTLLTEFNSGLTRIHRAINYTPVITTGGWVTLTYTIPTTYNTNNCYIAIVGMSDFGNDMLIDNMVINTYPINQVYVNASGFVNTQNTSTTGPGATNQQIIGLRLTMDGLANPRTLTSMSLNTNGSTNPPTDIANAKLWFSGGSDLFSTANATLLGTFINPHTTNYFFLQAHPNLTGPASFNGLVHGDNYLWITYDISGSAVSGNYVDAEWFSFTITNALGTPVPQTPVTQTITGGRQIDVVYCQPTYFTGTSWLNYQTNDFINGVQLTGDNIPVGGIGTVPGTNSGNPRNTISAAAGPLCPGPVFPRTCPWQRHPPDYERFPEVAAPGALVTTNLTTQLTTSSGIIGNPNAPLGSGHYTLQTMVGNYNSGNANAVWIDYTGDGTFNNYFDNIVKVGTASGAGSTTISISNAATTNGSYFTYGLNVGMTVYHPNVPAGTYITAINSTTQITISAPTTGGFTSSNIEFVNEGISPIAPYNTWNRGEKIQQSGPLGAWGKITSQFKVPEWAANFAGKRRMRVREVWINYNIDPCASYTYGETEDYTVTIRPDCPVYPGYKTWLGFTDDWTDPSNWCPAGAPIFGNVMANLRFPGGPTGGTYAYTKAAIKAGTLARAQKFRIEANDTVFVDAPAYLNGALSPSDLYITDSLKIDQPTSVLKVTSNFSDTAQVYNGLLTDQVLVPFKPGTKVRNMWAFRLGELLAFGMQDGDVIDTLKFHIQRNSNGNPYKNVKVKWYWALATVNFGGLAVPAGQTPQTTPVTVFSGDLDFSTFVPTQGDWGTISIPLSGNGIPIQTAVNRSLIIDISYDHSGGFPLTGGTPGVGLRPNDYFPNYEDMRHTQTQALNLFMSYSANTTNPAFGPAETQNFLAATVNVQVTANAPIGATVISVNTTTNVFPGMVFKTGALANREVTAVGPGLTVTLSQPLTTAITASATPYTLDPYIAKSLGSNNKRPNITFTFKRRYDKYPIFVAGHWLNNGNFIPAISKVTMNGSATQRFEGTQTTTFHELDINNNAHVIQFADIVVQDTLSLLNGRMKLNNRLLTLELNTPAAITRTNGFLQADNDVIGSNVAPYSRVRWIMGTDMATRDLPFINAGGSYLPLTYQPLSGSHDVTFTTYRTNPDNTNIPSPTVTNIFGFNGTAWNSDGTALADRFYRVENATPTGASADFTFRYQAGTMPTIQERAQANPTGATTMKAQRWLNDSTKWEQFPFYHPTQTYGVGAGFDWVRVEGFNMGTAPAGSWWVITGQSTPLPVTLLDFVAEPFKDKVKLKWSTSAELNASHYVVERTLNQEEFSFIGQVPANGTTSSRTDYHTWDMNPAQGIQYYYLRQYDRDGAMTSYGPVSAKFSSDVFDIVTATISSSEMGVTVVFSYDSNEPVSYKVIDMTGRVLVAKDKQPATPGMNVIDIDASLAKGAYQIMIQNREKTVSRKFFY